MMLPFFLMKISSETEDYIINPTNPRNSKNIYFWSMCSLENMIVNSYLYVYIP